MFVEKRILQKNMEEHEVEAILEGYYSQVESGADASKRQVEVLRLISRGDVEGLLALLKIESKRRGEMKAYIDEAISRIQEGELSAQDLVDFLFTITSKDGWREKIKESNLYKDGKLNEEVLPQVLQNTGRRALLREADEMSENILLPSEALKKVEEVMEEMLEEANDLGSVNTALQEMNDLFGIILTAHPTFGSPDRQAKLLKNITTFAEVGAVPLTDPFFESPENNTKDGKIVKRSGAVRLTQVLNQFLDLQFDATPEGLDIKKEYGRGQAAEKQMRADFENLFQIIYAKATQKVRAQHTGRVEVPPFFKPGTWIGFDSDGRGKDGRLEFSVWVAEKEEELEKYEEEIKSILQLIDITRNHAKFNELITLQERIQAQRQIFKNRREEFDLIKGKNGENAAYEKMEEGFKRAIESGEDLFLDSHDITKTLQSTLEVLNEERDEFFTSIEDDVVSAAVSSQVLPSDFRVAFENKIDDKVVGYSSLPIGITLLQKVGVSLTKEDVLDLAEKGLFNKKIETEARDSSNGHETPMSWCLAALEALGRQEQGELATDLSNFNPHRIISREIAIHEIQRLSAVSEAYRFTGAQGQFRRNVEHIRDWREKQEIEPWYRKGARLFKRYREKEERMTEEEKEERLCKDLSTKIEKFQGKSPTKKKFTPDFTAFVETAEKEHKEHDKEIEAMAKRMGHKLNLIDVSATRLLLANCDKESDILTTLMLLEKHGIADKVDIMPLFEDNTGLEESPAITQRILERKSQTIQGLLGNKVFLEYLRKRHNTLHIELGHSDAGRFAGAPAAHGVGGFIWKAKEGIVKAAEAAGITVVFYDTGARRAPHRDGHSTDRDHAHANVMHSTKHLREEVSFQGEDYHKFQTPNDVIKYFLAFLETRTGKAFESDPALESGSEMEKMARKFSEAFREGYTEYFSEEKNGQEYRKLLSVVFHLAESDGSRAKARTVQLLIEKWRAIVQGKLDMNTGAFLVLLGGGKKALEAVGGKDGLMKMWNESESSRRFLKGMVRALKKFDPEILKMNAELVKEDDRDNEVPKMIEKIIQDFSEVREAFSDILTGETKEKEEEDMQNLRVQQSIKTDAIREIDAFVDEVFSQITEENWVEIDLAGSRITYKDLEEAVIFRKYDTFVHAVETVRGDGGLRELNIEKKLTERVKTVLMPAYKRANRNIRSIMKWVS